MWNSWQQHLVFSEKRTQSQYPKFFIQPSDWFWNVGTFCRIASVVIHEQSAPVHSSRAIVTFVGTLCEGNGGRILTGLWPSFLIHLQTAGLVVSSSVGGYRQGWWVGRERQTVHRGRPLRHRLHPPKMYRVAADGATVSRDDPGPVLHAWAVTWSAWPNRQGSGSNRFFKHLKVALQFSYLVLMTSVWWEKYNFSINL